MLQSAEIEQANQEVRRIFYDTNSYRRRRESAKRFPWFGCYKVDLKWAKEIRKELIREVIN